MANKNGSRPQARRRSLPGVQSGRTEIRLEVHHRDHGTPGPCGQCVLTGVDDDDLTTLCVECHDEVTNIRRRVRYVGREIAVANLEAPHTHPSTVPTRQPVDADAIAAVTMRTGHAPPRVQLW